MTSDGSCDCRLPENVRSMGGWHIEKLTLTRARDVLYEKAARAEPPPLNEARRRELWQDADELAPKYEGTDLALGKCPSYEDLERSRIAAIKRQKARESGRRGPRSEE